MKRLVQFLAFGLLCSSAAVAAAPYVGAGVGYWLESRDPVFNARLGWDVAKTGIVAHAVEAEFLTGKDKDSGGSVRLTSGLANYKARFEVTPDLYVAVGGGLGVTRVKANIYWFHDTSSAFTYHLITTAGLRFAKQWSVEASVRYLNVGEADYGWFKARVGDDTSLELGLKYQF